MPTISLPRFQLPEGLRDMTAEDIGKAMPEVHLPKVDVDAIGKRAGKVVDEVAKNAGKAVDDVAKSAGKVVDDVAKSVSSNVEQALPRRPGPSPVPFAVLGMLGGLIVGWLLATSPTTAPRINAFMDWLRTRIDDWRVGRNADLDDAFEDAAEELRSDSTGLEPVMAEPDYAGSTSSAMHTGTGYADEEPWSDRPELRGQSLGAAAADDFQTGRLDAGGGTAEDAEAVIVVDDTGTAEIDSGSGRMTDQMKIDNTEGDQSVEADPPTSDGLASSGRLTETMKFDNSDDEEEVRPAPADRF
jgi:hypothetical protein